MDTDQLLNMMMTEVLCMEKATGGKVVRSEFSYYILNHLFLGDRCVASGVLQQPIGKLLALVGVAVKAFFYFIPKQAFSTRDVRIAFHFLP
jgi:hypothetical protein